MLALASDAFQAADAQWAGSAGSSSPVLKADIASDIIVSCVRHPELCDLEWWWLAGARSTDDRANLRIVADKVTRFLEQPMESSIRPLPRSAHYRC